MSLFICWVLRPIGFIVYVHSSWRSRRQVAAAPAARMPLLFVSYDDDWHHIRKREVLGDQRRQGHYNYSSTACSTFRHRFVWRLGSWRKRSYRLSGCPLTLWSFLGFCSLGRDKHIVQYDHGSEMTIFSFVCMYVVLL